MPGGLGHGESGVLGIVRYEAELTCALVKVRGAASRREVRAAPAKSSATSTAPPRQRSAQRGAALREVLIRALGGAGLVNYPPEWWHWPYGDRYLAASSGAPSAAHAPLEPPVDQEARVS